MNPSESNQLAPQPLDDPQQEDIQTYQHDPNHPRAWTAHANCKGATHLMFPKAHKDITYIAEARRICNECTVKDYCLDYALTYPAGDMHGVWAGLTPRQLAAEQRRRNIRPTVPTLAQMWSDLTREA